MNKFKNKGFIYKKIATANDVDIWSRSNGVMFLNSFYADKDATQSQVVNCSSVSSKTILDAN